MSNDRHKQTRSTLTGDFMSTSNTISKIGAVFYIIWACLHLLAAYSVYVLGRSLDSSMVQGRVFQDAWNLLFFSIIAISVAATLRRAYQQSRLSKRPFDHHYDATIRSHRPRTSFRFSRTKSTNALTFGDRSECAGITRLIGVATVPQPGKTGASDPLVTKSSPI